MGPQDPHQKIRMKNPESLLWGIFDPMVGARAPEEAPGPQGPQRRWTGVSLKNSLSTVVSKTREF